MPTLHIEHPITDFDTWNAAFGRFVLHGVVKDWHIREWREALTGP